MRDHNFRVAFFDLANKFGQKPISSRPPWSYLDEYIENLEDELDDKKVEEIREDTSIV